MLFLKVAFTCSHVKLLFQESDEVAECFRRGQTNEEVDVVRHDDVATGRYSVDIVRVSAELDKGFMNVWNCKARLSFFSADCHEIQRLRDIEGSQSWWRLWKTGIVILHELTIDGRKAVFKSQFLGKNACLRQTAAEESSCCSRRTKGGVPWRCYSTRSKLKQVLRAAEKSWRELATPLSGPREWRNAQG